MRRIRSKASRAGFQASEEKRVQKVEVLEVEGRSVQVRSGLTLVGSRRAWSASSSEPGLVLWRPTAQG